MESIKCLFVLVAAVLVVYASAGKEKKEDTRPFCYRNFTEAEGKEMKDIMKKCKDGLSDDDKKDRKAMFSKIVCCFMTEKELVKDGNIVENKLTESIDNFGLDDYKEPLKKLVTECKDNAKCEEYVKCVHKKKDELPCKCHKKCKHGGKKGGKKESDEDNKEEEEADVPA